MLVEFIENLLSVGSYDEDTHFPLGISKIHNIPVYTELQFTPRSDKPALIIEIVLVGFYYHRYNLMMTFETEEDMKIQNNKILYPDKFVKHLQKVFKEIKVDVFHGSFTMDESIDYGEVANIFKKEHIVLDFGECIECMTNTNTYTNCGIWMCIKCWNNIPCCDFCKADRRCPLCNDKIEHYIPFCQYC